MLGVHHTSLVPCWNWIIHDVVVTAMLVAGCSKGWSHTILDEVRTPCLVIYNKVSVSIGVFSSFISLTRALSERVGELKLASRDTWRRSTEAWAPRGDEDGHNAHSINHRIYCSFLFHNCIY